MTATVASAVDPVHLASEDTTGGALAASRATAFMRAQVSWLQRGLAGAGDAVVVDLVLSAHDRSHERWLGIMRHVTAHLGEEAAQQVGAVYACAGATAGALEHGRLDLLAPQVAARARVVLSKRLQDLTEATVESLWQIAARA